MSAIAKNQVGLHKDVSIDFADLKIAQCLSVFSPIPARRISALILKPWWSKQHSDFQQIIDKIWPGSHLVGHHDKMSSLLASLITKSPKTKIFIDKKDNVVYIDGEQGACHANVDRLRENNEIENDFIGYALSEDGLWRYHSWGTLKEKIVETTERRLVYIGLPRDALCNKD